MTEDPRAAFDVAGRVAVVSGGSRGLGRAIAGGLARSGARVVVSSRDADSCERTATEIRDGGGEVLAVAADVGSLDDHRRIISETVDRFGRIDVLVNNAGLSKHVLVEDLAAADYDRVHGVNAKGPLFLAQAALPYLAANRRGSVINVLSVGIWIAGEGMVLCRSSKRRSRE